MMQRTLFVTVFLLFWSASSHEAQTKATQSAAGQPAMAHKVIIPDKIAWTHPPNFPAGFDLAVVEGDPSQEGLFTLRIKGADGTVVRPHWHPSDENITVIKGVFLLGTGDRFDKAALQALPSGAFSFMPKEMRHFGQCKGQTIVQVHGMGPFKVIYVNPADDPANKATKK